MLPESLAIEEQPASLWITAPEPSGERPITRQAIRNGLGRIQGYELLPGIEHRATLSDDSEAARTILDDLVLFGYDRLTQGLPAFVRCSAEALADRLFEVLPAPMTVIEIPLSLPLSSKLLEACCELRHSGFRLALVDCLTDPETHPLFDLADYVKVDLICMPAATLQNLRRRLSERSATLIAENLESSEEHRQAIQAGCTHYQGSAIAPPEPLRYAKLPANPAVHIEILKQLFPDPLNLGQLTPLVMRDPSLVYRLLRTMTSPVSAIRRKVESILEAITYVGEETFRRIATLAIRCELNAEHPPEILHKALVRAKFCELAAPLAKLKPGEQYLIGLMSMLPAMLRVPMTALAGELPLRQAAVEALLGAAVPERTLLDWIEALERTQFAECYRIADIHNLGKEKLDRCYLEALTWETEESAVPQ
jgi:EAL and modified HD-GYP domain-containing signal transduction protein